MATVNFILKHPNGKVSTPIVMVFAFGKKHIKIQIGTKILPKSWNQEAARLRVPRNNDNPIITNLNNRLDGIAKSILACYNDHLNKNGTLFTDQLKKEFKEIIRPTGKRSPVKKTFLEGAQEYHDSCKKKPWTKKHYLTTINILEKYEESLGKKIFYEDINMDFYYDFIDWMEKKARNKEKSYALNTIGSHVKEIKVFMNAALDNGWTECTGHLHRKFVTIEETSDSIYLDTEEIDKIYRLELKNQTLDQVRDLFIIGCWTGLRYSDLTQITPDKFIKNGTMLKVRTEKTGETVIIPLHPYVRDIIAKRDGHPPKAYEDQPMNRYLKIVSRLAGLTEKVSKTITRGGIKVTTSYFKWQLVTVHTARRSFATNAYLEGIPTLSIMKITSHKTERSFLKYIKITQEENATLIKDHRFFQLKVS